MAGLCEFLLGCLQFSAQNAVLRRNLRRLAFDDPPAATNETFLEIPLDVAPAGYAFHPDIQWICGAATHLDLAREQEGNIVVGAAERPDLGFGARLQVPNGLPGNPLTTNPKGANSRSGFSNPLILGREAAFARDIDDKHQLAAEILP